MKKIMISVAPVAATDKLINPRTIAEDVYECYKLGASMVHLHVRDLHGKLTPDLTLLNETIALIRQKCDIVIEISTGGVSNLTIEERCQPCYASYVEATSLNVGSVNLGDSVYQNPIRDVHYCVEQILENHKTPEIEVFELGMINTVRELDEQYHFNKPIQFALVFGHGGEMPATVPALKHMLEALQENFTGEKDILWGYTQTHRQDWDMFETALDMGASSVRIGFEDSDYIAPGIHAKTNAELIAKIAEIVKSKGMKPMTTAEARNMLKITPLSETSLDHIPGAMKTGVERLDCKSGTDMIEEFWKNPYVKKICIVGHSEKGQQYAEKFTKTGCEVSFLESDNIRQFLGGIFLEKIKTTYGIIDCDLCILAL